MKSSRRRKEKGTARRRIAGPAAFVLLCFIPVASHLAFGAVVPAVFAVFTLLTGILFLLIMIDAIRGGELGFRFNPLPLPVLALLILGLVQLLPFGAPAVPEGVISGRPSSSLSLDQSSTINAVIKLFAFLVFLVSAMLLIRDDKRVRIVAVGLVGFGGLMAFFGVLQWLADPSAIYGLIPAAQAKPFGPYVNSHHFASFLLMNLSVGLGLIIGGGLNRDKLPLLVIAVVVMGAGIVFTGSRGAYLSLLSVLAFVFVMRIALPKIRGEKSGRKNTRTGVLALGGGLAGLLAVITLVVLLSGGEQGLLRSAGMQEAGPDFSTGRLHYWSVAVSIFLDNPVIGTGLETFGTAFTKYDSWSGIFRVEHAHNEYLQMLADGGVTGLLLVAAFIVLLFRQAFKVLARSSGIRASAALGSLAGCFGILVHSVVDFPLRTSANAFFFLLLCVLATSRLRD